MTQTEALKLALDYLYDHRMGGHVIAAIKEALANHIEDNLAMVAQPEQEPVAWFRNEDIFGNQEMEPVFYATKAWENCQPLYTTPPQRTWVGLTDKEAHELWESTDSDDDWELMKRTEAKLKEKNTS